MQDGWLDHLKLLIAGGALAAGAAGESRTRRGLLLWPRIAWSVGREVAHGQPTLRAASLVYTTLLSLVPLLAVSFALLKGFGVHAEAQGWVFGALEPLGESGREIGARIIGFVDNIKVGVLGSVGLLVLIYTVISMLQKTEEAFNEAWRVTRPRPLRERISHYLSAVVVGPLLVFSSIGITATIMGSQALRDLAAYDPFGVVMTVAGKTASYLLVIGAFTFLYVYMPNARVRLRSALAGAVVAGVLWELAGWAFASFVVGSTRYTAIYSGFAVLVVFMLWLYAAWLVLLIGASVAFYHQHRDCLGLLAHEANLSNRLRERVALSALLLIAVRHLRGWPGLNEQRIAGRLGVPVEPLLRLLRSLAAHGIVVQPAPEGPWLPARDLSELLVLDAIIAVREAFEGPRMGLDRVTVEPAVEELAGRMETAAAEVAGDMTLREWALANAPPAAEQAPTADDTEPQPPPAPSAAPPPEQAEDQSPMPTNTVALEPRKRDAGKSR